MDKNKLKTFAIESRRQLIEDTTYQANLLGISAEKIQDPIEEAEGMQAFNIGGTKPYIIYDEDIEKRNNLVKEVTEKGFENVIEEVAYTWFNRIIAIRYMEVNNYLPTRIRVLSSETPGKTEPDIIKEAPHIDLNLTQQDIQTIYKLKEENKNDDLFQFLFIKQCNKLNKILPGLFQKTNDINELLFNLSFSQGVIYNLINDISEEDFKEEVEIIGWLYQYYISDKKDQIINIYKGNIKKEDIPAATQLFTTDWIVKYMVDNSLGRYWIERNKNSTLLNKIGYYLEESKQNEETNLELEKIRENSLKPEEIKFLDPCMGSGHILVYAFEVFKEIYTELGYSKQDIPELILKNNIYGLDIDNRAYQLAYFALLMKARSYDKNILNKKITPHVFPIEESKQISEKTIEYIKNYDKTLADNIQYLREVFYFAKEYGSLIQLKTININEIELQLNEILNESNQNISNLYINKNIENEILPLINQAKILSQKYDTVVTNPPYMNKFEKSLKEFSKKYYKDYSKDLFSMFIYRNFNFCKENGYSALMTPFVWMFIKNYEKLREYIINEKNISSLIQLEYSAFTEATVPICTFVLCNNHLDYNGTYLRLSDFTGGMEVQKQKTLEATNSEVNYKYISKNEKFSYIPGSPIAYWADDNLIESFKNGIELKKIGDMRQGLATSDNKRFLKFWYEVDFNKVGLNCSNAEVALNVNKKWYPYNKGGNYRKWYGNQSYLINYENDGYELKGYAKKLYKTPTRTIKSISEYFKPCLSWSKISSGNIAFRYYPKGFIFDVAGCCIFFEEYSNFNYIFGFLNSKVSKNILDCISPTLNYEVGHIASLPIIFNNDYKSEINDLVKDNISLCKSDWDDYEVSWNFKVHPFIKFKDNNLNDIFDIWSEFKNNQFNQLKSNEIKLNQIYNEIYEVDYDCSIQDKHVSINKVNKKDDVKSFLSYFVGCLFGRYSLDVEGLVFAAGEFDLCNYSSFVPDGDNIVPVLDSEYFDDDVVGRFVDFVKVAFGSESLEDNLDFIAGALNNKGKTSREVIRSYFLSDFFKDHVKLYKKCPIYWLFDSGKENGFKCLVYMHRYSPDLVARVRTDYLHKTQKAIESQISYQQNIKENSGNSKDQARADKRIKKLTKQLDETRRYDEALAHVASQNITIDLDDGVKVNYAKFQNVEVSKEGQKVKKINLLKKI